jgi:hypothetical protein
MKVAMSIALLTVSTSLARLAEADEKKTCVDAYVSAQALRDDHHLLAARDQLRVCARQECAPFMRGQIVTECTNWLGQVEGAIPSLIFDVRDGSGNDLSAVRVTMDGVLLAERLDGSAVPVDPGEHRFVFDASDQPRAEKVVVVREGEKARHVGVMLAPKRSTSDGPRPIPRTDASESPTGAYVSFGIGGAALVVGAISGILALGMKSTLDNECKPDGSCPRQDHIDSYHTYVAVTVIGFVAAGVGGTVGFLLLPPKGGDRTPTVSVTPRIGLGWIGLGGSFQ